MCGKSDQGGFYCARDRLCPGPDFPALIALVEWLARPCGPAILRDTPVFSIISWRSLTRWPVSLRAVSPFSQGVKAALVQILVLVACLVAALMFFAFGYVFLIASAIAAIARARKFPGSGWRWVAALHFVLSFFLLVDRRSLMTKPPFRELAELKKDREWLKNLDKKSRRAN